MFYPFSMTFKKHFPCHVQPILFFSIICVSLLIVCVYKMTHNAASTPTQERFVYTQRYVSSFKMNLNIILQVYLLCETRPSALIDIFYMNTLRQVIPWQMLPNLILPHNTIQVMYIHGAGGYLFLHFLIHVPHVADRRRLCPSGVQSYVNGSLDQLKFASPSH